MNKKYPFLLLIAVFSLLIACEKTTADETVSMSINPKELSLRKGETRMLTIEVSPKGTTLGNVAWMSTNEGIATVEDGLLTAKEKGSTIIIAVSGTLKAYCNVEVDRVAGFTSISVLPTSLDMNVGETKTLEVNAQPENLSLNQIKWETSNEKVATVEGGKITAIGHGKATITAYDGEVKAACSVNIAEPKRTYKLIWSDEFDGAEINTDKWNFEIGGAGWGNQEKQYYTDRKENARIEDGCLVIDARKENYQSNAYTSARLTTKDKMFIKYGKVEARISLPAGRGTWPAFWMMPNKSVYGGWPRSGEIDIMEHVGKEPTMISHALHTRASSAGTCWDKRVYYDNVENNFHVYTLEWIDDYYNGNDAFIFYVDGIQSIIKDQRDYKTSTWEDWPFDQDFFVILNLAIGGSWGGNIDDSIFNNPVQMKVDYVRVYQLEE